jgi:glycosyltransferase involved in cell wall biosynthesis
MTILSCVHMYPPHHMCGSEMMLHAINKHLQSKGHTVKVLVKGSHRFKLENHMVYDDIDLFGADSSNEMNLFRTADLVITHLDYASWTQEMASIFNIPCVHLIHNDYDRPHLRDSHKPQYVVYNSKWIGEKLKYPQESYILIPPTDWRHYDTKVDVSKNEYITLINLDGNKGGEILAKLSAQMPNRKFIGVIGSYSEPAKTGQFINQPPNVEVLGPQQDIRKVYERTRILIMPSKYESWGRTATEAMCSGIPVICTPTSGLVENCGNAGIFVRDREDIEKWVKEINKLFDEKAYTKASEKAKIRSRELDPRKNLDEFAEWLRKVQAAYPYK